ncbi:Ferric reductase transmembrane component 3 [Golovinomyces cichoracearum]|uniref:ferric-chelate reductase (NADPH) n=1 Tax=Golovinomyces cichoracearum TaxID=62708 RepID=A0A420IAH6_9PEZI|nr:Ferric reductase transmembrane component 3 [Golovinomyces cichoracearum]
MHIQDPSKAKELVPHWGYADRVLPCTNDAGTCAYLDSIYRSHDFSMVFSFILWATIVCIVITWGILRLLNRFGNVPLRTTIEIEGQRKSTSSSLYSRVTRTSFAFVRRHLFPTFPGSTFSHASRLQVLILAILSAYILIFSLVGITYQSWETPNLQDPSVFDTRTGFGGFADRVGVFAFALTPLAIFLSTRESILTLITGLSYQHFIFLHRWTGRLIFMLGSIHTLGWMIVKGCLYQPQPSTFNAFIIQPYILWGVAAMICLIFLYAFSIKSVIQYTGYEFFLISHLISAILFIVMCWKHWPNLECWIIASLVTILFDFALRMLSFVLIHFNILGKKKGFVAPQANISFFDDLNGKVVRLDFEHVHQAWQPGQHFFLTFPALSIWQSHPFTTISSPHPNQSIQKHSYIIRCRTGETAKIGALEATNTTTSVLLSGPYGSHKNWHQSPNILAITGGTGISFTIPILHEAALHPGKGFLQLVWIIRRLENLEWARPELEALKKHPSIHVLVLVTSGNNEKNTNYEKDLLFGSETDKYHSTKDKKDSEIFYSERFEIIYMNRRPDMTEIIGQYLKQAQGDRVLIIGSGPPQMGVDARTAAASFNYPKKVWRGEEKGDVEFYWDY